MEKVNPKTIWQRLISPTPAFWRKIRNFMLTLGAIGAALKGLPESIIPIWMTNALVTIGAVGAGLAQMTCQDPAK